MKTKDFTPEQTELILKAVSNLVDCNGNTYSIAQKLNDVTNSYIQPNISKEVEGNGFSLALTPEWLSDVLSNTTIITDLLFSIEDAINKN